MAHQLPPLPYAPEALEPHISRETMECHHGKHHKTYVDKLNSLIKGTQFENMPLEEIVRRADGGVFKEEFSTAAENIFGSGWAWLVKRDDGSLAIEPMPNADAPLRFGTRAVLTLDVWEHAYYIDYRNKRPDFIAAFWNVVNWDFAAQNYSA